MIKTPVVVLYALLSLSAFAQELVPLHELPRVAMSDVEALDFPDRKPRVRNHKWLPPMTRFGTSSTPLLLPATVPSIPAMPMTRAFTSARSQQLVPADASGAVGKSHVVGVYNNAVIVHDRTGNVLKAVGLREFWATSQFIGDQYDPRAVYDATADRWIITAVDREDTLLIAVSDSGDPAGTWRRLSLHAPAGEWFDFSRLALTRDSVIVATCTGQGDFLEATVLFSIPKETLYTPVPVVSRKYTYPSDAGIVPVHGDAPAEYVITLFHGKIFFGTLGQTHNQMHRIDEMPFRLDPPNSELPQLNGRTLQGSEPQIENAVYRNGNIHAVFTLGDDRATVRSGIGWIRIQAQSLATSWGSWHDPNEKTYYAYPSIAAGANGSFVIGFGTFSATQYPSAAYLSGDLLGRISNVTPILNGETPVDVEQRWGDYTTTVSDPVEPNAFWTVQIVSTNGSWGTVWAKIEQPDGRRRAVRH